jgi:hypothetical protein
LDRLTDKVRKLYVQQRAPIAFMLVGLITVAGVLDYSPLQLAAGVALLGLILQVLLEIDAKVTGPEAEVWYSTFQEAAPHINGEIESRLRRGPVRIRWIGVTQEAGWPLVQNLLLKIFEGKFGPTSSLKVDLALLDPDGGICKRAEGPDRDQIRATKEKIARFINAHSSDFVARRSNVMAYLYDYRPTWHALLVDDDLLYFSTCLPQNLPFASPQGGVEVVRLGQGEPDVERIRHFVAWFEWIVLEARATERATTPKATGSS